MAEDNRTMTDPREIKIQFMAFCQLATMVSLEEAQLYLNELDRWDTVGPILQPTEWRANRNGAERDRALFSAFIKFRQSLDAVLEAEAQEPE